MVLPVYELELSTGKGPRFFTAQGEIVAPDMFVFPAMQWIEAKHKTVFSWHRISGRWVTGIDLHHYQEYLRILDVADRPVWLLFLHRESTPAQHDMAYSCPSECPTGLFGNDLRVLARNINHQHKNHGRHGMVYWAVENLRLLARLDDLEAAA